MRHITPNIGDKVQMSQVQEREVCLGVERTWQILCTLPALWQESSGLRQLGLTSTAERQRRILGLSLYGNLTWERSWVGLQDDGKYYLGTTVTQFVHECDLSLEQ